MPFESKAQQRFMYARHPKIAEEFAKKTDFSKLPEKKETQEGVKVQSYITHSGKYIKTHERTNPLKDELADLESNSSAQSDALNKEDMPKPFRSHECADVFMNVKKDVEPIRGALETSEDDTLMGRLAKRMAARDYIDQMNLGMGTKAQRTGKAAFADLGTEIAESIPSRKVASGPALKVGTEIEKEHLGTFKKVESGKLSAEDAPKEVAKDHIKEIGPAYYDELPELEQKLKKNVKTGGLNDLETSSKLQEEKGFGLHLQTSDISAFNSSDPISSTNQRVMPGRNMAEQARLQGNIFNSEEPIIAPDQK